MDINYNLMMLMLKHFHRHVKKVVEFPVDVRHSVTHEERHICDSSVEFFAHILAGFLERLRDSAKQFDLRKFENCKL